MAEGDGDDRGAGNYAARTSPHPTDHSWRTFQQRMRPDRETILRDLFTVAAHAPDTVVSNYHERRVWRVSQFGADEEGRTTQFVASDYDDEEDRFPTIESFLQTPLDPRVGNFHLKVEYEGRLKGDIDVAPPSPSEKAEYAVLQRVLAALTALFMRAKDSADPTPPHSVLATLRHVHIDVAVNERFGEKILMDMVHMLSELEIAFEAFAASVVMPWPSTRIPRIFSRFPLSLSYHMVTMPKYHEQPTGKRVPALLPFVSNHLRIGGEQQERAWKAASWDPLNATATFRQEKRMAATTVHERRVRGRNTRSRLDSASDEDAVQPMVVAQSIFSIDI